MTTETKQYFTTEEALKAIKETLENGYEGHLCDLQNEVFNTDYYIVGTAQAVKALEEYGVFDAIRKIEEYEKFNFGQVFTTLSDPEKVANMLYFIVGDTAASELINELEDTSAEVVTEEISQELINLIDEKLN